MTTTLTARKIAQTVAIARAVAETIRESSPCPAGSVYLALQHHGLSYEVYESLITALENAKLVKKSAELLTWIGPPFKS